MSGQIDELKQAGIKDSLKDAIISVVNDRHEMQASKTPKRAADDVNVGSGKKAKKKCQVRGCNTSVHNDDKDKLSCYKHMDPKYKQKPCTMMIPVLDQHGQPLQDDNGVVITKPCKLKASCAGGKCRRCSGGDESIKASRKCTICNAVTLVRSGLKCRSCKAAPACTDSFEAMLKEREEREEKERRAREEE